ncbi:hypothetical protein MRS76_11280 [Rhizobiaceae bacterium n13]|uniref:hypothetical protein n=1 Tax=Ferirhizobium litorale TaxID=2927786 RepID=UPI0024B2FE19|nr:hypothetical protein [Fererhizobium litorale]MDI7862543.1 hypothetical protein [Fererhizobium litorale]
MSGYLDHAIRSFEEAYQEYSGCIGTEHEAAAAKHRLILFGVAAITLDAARVDKKLPAAEQNRWNDERDEFIGLAYMLRCCPAHDISEPKWIMREGYQRKYQVAGLEVDLSGVNDQPFRFDHIGGEEAFIRLARYAQHKGWA